MRFVTFRSAQDNVPAPGEASWPEVVRDLTTHERRAEKDGPCWSPARYRAGTTRANRNVEAVTAAMFDLDHLAPEAVPALAERLNATGYAYCVHSTFSSKPTDVCLRLVLPISREISPQEWPILRLQLISELQLPADRAVRDPARLYYLPACPPGAPDPLAHHEPGCEVPVDQLLARAARSAAPVAAPPSPGSGTTGAALPARRNEPALDLEGCKTRLRRLRRADSKELVKRVLEGQPLGQPGERDSALQRAVSVLAFTLPESTPDEVLLELLRPSVEAMPGPDAPTMNDAREKLSRARQERRENEVRKAEQEEATRRALAQAAVANTGEAPPRPPEPALPGQEEREPHPATGPYTAEQIAAWAQEQGTSPEGFERRWLIQKGSQFYVFSEGRYLPPISREDLEVSLRRDLARAPVPLVRFTQNGGVRPAKMNEVLADHATVARHVIASLVIQRSHYDERTQTFYEAVCPRRPLTPLYTREIQDWLELLGGTEASRLLDWVATITRLDRQTCALYLDGVGSAGKGLLANGLARLWTVGTPTELASVLSGFNSALTSCPLVFADEALPNRRGAQTTAELRRIIGSSTRALSRKYLADATLHGAVRLILAANNDRLLETDEELSADDVEAVAGRFLHVKVGKSAKEYLDHIGGAGALHGWVEGDLIARHALHLAATRQVREGSRFLVEGHTTQLHQSLATGSGVTGQVCEWLAGYLLNPRPIADSPHSTLARAGEGELLVNTSALAEKARWEAYVSSTHVPTTTSIGRALRNLAVGTVRLAVDDTGRRLAYHRVRGALILAWAERNQVGDVDAMKAALERPDPVLGAWRQRNFASE